MLGVGDRFQRLVALSPLGIGDESCDLLYNEEEYIYMINAIDSKRILRKIWYSPQEFEASH